MLSDSLVPVTIFGLANWVGEPSLSVNGYTASKKTKHKQPPALPMTLSCKITLRSIQLHITNYPSKQKGSHPGLEDWFLPCYKLEEAPVIISDSDRESVSRERGVKSGRERQEE